MKYRVQVQVSATNTYFVEAENEDAAAEAVLNGDYYDVDYGDENVDHDTNNYDIEEND